MKWFWIILAVIYLVSPIDLIPGFHLPGWIDDAVVLGLLFRYLMKLKNTGAGGPARNGEGRSERAHSASEAGADGTGARSPHEVLGIAPDADQEEIRAAYRRLANQYHPDKVTHLGEEFHALAEQRFKEIQSAYDALRR